MQSQNKFLDDLAKVLNGAAGTIAGMAREAENSARERTRDWVGASDAISREEFETLKDMVKAARSDIADLNARLDTMGAAPKPKKKP